MELENYFTVPAETNFAWQLLTDLEKIAPCMPGATLLSSEDGIYTGRVKVKVGAIEIVYEGAVSIVELRPDERTAVLEATGRQRRGAGTVRARVTAQLRPVADGTGVTTATELDITGRPAQFGRGVLNDVAEKLLGQFSECLAAELRSNEGDGPDLIDSGGGGAVPSMPGGGHNGAEPSMGGDTSRGMAHSNANTEGEGAVDILSMVMPSVAPKVLASAGVGVAVLSIIWWIWHVRSKVAVGGRSNPSRAR